ncbi:hypothetical protein EYC84_000234 [Monilinia fructicola]|uniref:Secreted protein n=1 Tax=Monilinia fructicola TaxID=38448 RepID=A0A5M9JQZ9_MONFR|nr:hypothetical protein EYC84_000234 [Monilinia fructicola]
MTFFEKFEKLLLTMMTYAISVCVCQSQDDHVLARLLVKIINAATRYASLITSSAQDNQSHILPMVTYTRAMKNGKKLQGKK